MIILYKKKFCSWFGGDGVPLGRGVPLAPRHAACADGGNRKFSVSCKQSSCRTCGVRIMYHCGSRSLEIHFSKHMPTVQTVVSEAARRLSSIRSMVRPEMGMDALLPSRPADPVIGVRIGKDIAFSHYDYLDKNDLSILPKITVTPPTDTSAYRNDTD